MNQEEKEQGFFVDWRHILSQLLKKAWLIVAVGLVLAVAAGIYYSSFVTPQYSSSVMLYVNNKKISMEDISISAADLSASQSLIDTYIVILKNRTTMEEVAERAGVSYHYGKLMSMISTSKVEGTEVFRVTVTSEDPYEATHIANCISEVLPVRIEEIIDGSSMRVVDSAVVNTNKIFPNVSKEAMAAFLIGVLATAALVVLFAVLDDTIRGEDYIVRTYDLPVLAIIPDFDDKNHSRYYRGYRAYRGYRSYRRYGYAQPKQGEGDNT